MLEVFYQEQRVSVIGVGEGRVANTRIDSNNVPLYTVRMDDPNATPDGFFTARSCELAPADTMALAIERWLATEVRPLFVPSYFGG